MGSKKPEQNRTYDVIPAIGCGLLRKSKPIVQNANPRTRKFALWSRIDLRKKRALFLFTPITRWEKKEDAPPQTRSLPSFRSAFPVPRAPTDPRSLSKVLSLTFLAYSPPLWKPLGEALLHETHQMKQVPLLKSNTTRLVELNLTV